MISDVAAASHPLQPISTPCASTTTSTMPLTGEWLNPDQPPEEESSSVDHLGHDDGREASPTFSSHPPSPKAPTDMVYADLFDNDRHPQAQSQTILYMGHATHNLSYLLGRKSGTAPAFLHYPVLTHLPPRRQFTSEESAFYRSRGDYDLPPQHIQDELIRTYFKVFHPTFPVLDRVQFARSYKDLASPPSLILLQAMFMAAATHCPLEVLTSAGFKNRHEAKRTFFRRTKALYDAEYEQNRVVNVQALFLMQFWWDSPLEQKDSSYWLNASICLAQGCGMHRSTVNSGLSHNDRRHWRRCWACLCVS
jgi:hypothetical protein